MPRAAREYVTLQASPVRVENFHKNRAIVETLQRLASGKEIGWRAVPLYSSEDIENENLDEVEILAASGGRLPVIFVNVTFRTEELSGADLAEWERQFELKLLGEELARF